MARPLYRSRQVLHALLPKIAGADLAFARAVLSDGESRLFFAMERRDQRHALEVAGRLRQGTDDHDLLVAALLHDCGKGAVPVWLRIVKVISPRLLTKLARPTATGWRGAAYRLQAHVEIGESLARAAGASEGTLRLIAGRSLADEAWKATLLEAADDAS